MKQRHTTSWAGRRQGRNIAWETGGQVYMLNASQRACLEAIVHAVHPELQVEEASLDAQQTLQLVLCNDLLCFQPVRISTAEVDILAALAGQAAACQALQARLQAVLPERW